VCPGDGGFRVGGIDMLKMTSDLDMVLMYWMSVAMSEGQESYPVPVVKAMCALAWPGLRFEWVPDEGQDSYCRLCDMVCVQTGEDAQDMWEAYYMDEKTILPWLEERTLSRDEE